MASTQVTTPRRFVVELPLAGFFYFSAAFWRGSDEEPDDADADGVVSFCESCVIRPFRDIRAERGSLLAVLVTKTPRDQAGGRVSLLVVNVLPSVNELDHGMA
jgi:hypothetical protein